MSDGLVDSAILLLALGEETAAEVLRQLSPNEVERISGAMAGLRSIEHERLADVLQRFHGETVQRGPLVDDNDDYVRRVVTRALGEDRARPMLDRVVPAPRTSGLERLRWLDAVSVSRLLGAEHPQVIATALLHLEREHAAAVLGEFDPALRQDVLIRVATLDRIQPQALQEFDAVLAEALDSSPESGAADLGGAQAAAELLNRMGGRADQGVLDAIRETAPDLAREIEDLMFTFDDLAAIDDRGIQTLLREIPLDQLVVALKGADPALRDKVFRNMSQRAAESLREDLEARGPMRLSEVEAQQREILQLARRLAEEGTIMIGTGNEDTVV